MNLLRLLERVGRKRVIPDREGKEAYIERYYLLFPERSSKTREQPGEDWDYPFNVYLHHICQSDPQGLHDHPWKWASFILQGGYWEYTPQGKFWREVGSFRTGRAADLHRIEIDKELAGAETWTLFFVGPRIRDWGFIAANGVWTQWQQYLDLLKAEK